MIIVSVEDQINSTDNYVRRVLDMFAKHGDIEAIVAGERRITFAQLSQMVQTMTGTLQALGFRSGTTVAVLAANPPETIALHLALHRLGCRSVWIAKAPQRHQLDFLRQAQVDVFIYDPGSHAEFGRECAEAIVPMPVYCLGPDGIGVDLIAYRPSQDQPDIDELVDAPVSLFQTSGTTGSPKLVTHRHKLFQALPFLAERWIAEGRPVLRHLSIAGHWHVAAQMTTTMVLCMGGTLVLHNGFEPSHFLGLLEREKVTSTVLSPPMLYAILDSPSLATTDHSGLQVVTVGGAATAPSRLLQAIERLGPVIRIVYAMSESPGITEMPSAAVDAQHPQRARSAGLPYGDVRVEVRGSDGAVLPAGEVGEIWITSVLVTSGYWGEPELTAKTLVDGWLRTGDLGHKDEDGYLYVVDRVDDMILTGLGSTNVYTRPIEDVLLEHPGVRAAAVIGVPNETMGQAPYAYVVMAPGAQFSQSALIAHCTATLNETWTPCGVQALDSLPLVAGGKVDKHALRQRYQMA